jgi:hypothetical protein
MRKTSHPSAWGHEIWLSKQYKGVSPHVNHHNAMIWTGTRSPDRHSPVFGSHDVRALGQTFDSAFHAGINIM